MQLTYTRTENRGGVEHVVAEQAIRAHSVSLPDGVTQVGDGEWQRVRQGLRITSTERWKLTEDAA